MQTEYTEYYRVTTHLEKSGNSKVVREKSGKMEKVRGSVVFDAIRVAGMDVTKVDISNKIGCLRQSHSVYSYQSAQQLKKEKQSAEEKHAREDRKRKATIASLQQQKKQKLAELKAEAAAIDSKIASIIESGKD